MLLSEAILSFLNYEKTEKCLKSNTIKCHELDLKKFLRWIGDINVDAITSENVAKFRYFLTTTRSKSSANYGAELTIGTIEVAIINVRALLTYLAKKGEVSINPAEIKIKKITYKPKFALNCEELEKFLEVPRTDTLLGMRNRAMFEVMISTGLRRLETVNIDKNDVDLINGEIRVVGKGNKPAVVYLNERAIMWLKKYLEFRNDSVPALFINHLSLKRLTTGQVERVVMEAGAAAGIGKNVSPHILRHTAITMFHQKTSDVSATQRFARHSDIRTTYGIYVHFQNEDVKNKHRAVMNF